MSISSTNNRNDYVGNGAVDTYSYTFRILAQGDLRVTVADTDGVETTLTITTDYTVTGVGTESGGTVVLVNSAQAWLDGDGDLKTGYSLTIRRVVSLVQETDIRNQGDFFPEVHEDVFDYQVMIAQQLQNSIDRSVQLAETFSDSFSLTLPADLNTANYVLAINAAGNGFDMKSADEIIVLAGFLASANNLSDLSNVTTALVNLGIDPLSQKISAALTDGQSATNITGETHDAAAYTSVVYEYEVNRGSGTQFATGKFSLHYVGSTWQVVDGGFESSTGHHGLTFSVSQAGAVAQLRVATSSGPGAGTLKLKRHRFTA